MNIENPYDGYVGRDNKCIDVSKGISVTSTALTY